MSTGRLHSRRGATANPILWLSDGWATINERGWNRPLYWNEALDTEFTLGGMQPLDDDAPVCHVSYYEADAYARWAGARLPTEFEWEQAASTATTDGNLMDAAATGSRSPARTGQYFGDVWEWTSSAYAPYPGFRPLAGSLGEYNGKFMCNQQTVRGGSCVTAADHIRASYRSFFLPRCALAIPRLQPGKGRAWLLTKKVCSEIVAGLQRPSKEISPKYFYDERGSQLFDRITRLPEYYLTDTEIAIMRDNIDEIVALVGRQASLIEFGSGASVKTRILLEHLDALAAYVPVDISEDFLLETADDLRAAFPHIEVYYRSSPISRANSSCRRRGSCR